MRERQRHITFDTADELECRVVTYDWPFVSENAHAIEANWQARLAQGQRLWNGRVLVGRDARVITRDGRRVFQAEHFETSFAAFVAFRDFGYPDPRVRNCFGMAALRAADGPFLLARMGMHTANAGEIYFAAGTPDPGDIRGDRLDIEGSVLRELAEETGLTAADVTTMPGYTIMGDGGRVACMREIRTRAPADAVAAQVARFIATETDPELDGLVVVRNTDDLKTAAMLAFIKAYIQAKFVEEGQAPPG